MPRTDTALAGEAAAATPIGRSAPAKVNLALAVRGRRDDGYHLLQSLAVFTQLADRIEVQGAGEDSFAAGGPFSPDAPAGDGNLVVAARDALRAAFPGRLGPVAIRLHKLLPVAAGIGGGSSDAAAALKALSSLAGISAGDRLAEIGLGLGADVPMCLTARPLMAQGIGELIAPLDGFPALPLVLANPGVALSTATVFAALQDRENAPLPPLPRNWSADALDAWLAQARNDLEPPALRLSPPIGNVLAALRQAGARLARMSGSGATCFGLFDTAQAARRAAAAMARSEPRWWIAATTSLASGDTVDG